MRIPCPRLHIAVAVAINTIVRDDHRDSNLGPLTPQSDALTTRLLRPVTPTLFLIEGHYPLTLVTVAS